MQRPITNGQTDEGELRLDWSRCESSFYYRNHFEAVNQLPAPEWGTSTEPNHLHLFTQDDPPPPHPRARKGRVVKAIRLKQATYEYTPPDRNDD